MPIPLPEVPLKDICSVVFNNTLYTYSADAFQALPLVPGAEWKKLSPGKSVTGGVCVGSTPGDPSTAGLFIVGGKGKSAAYHGLQKFTYSKGTWETITLPQPVTQERLWHGATYINSTDSILMYAGSQDGNRNPSSQTFTIGASAPHTVLAFESAAPPTINPMLLPWSASEAVLIGGNDWNTKIMLFSTENKWVDSGASLVAPVPKDSASVKTIVVTGDDGSKNLYSFDMTVSPNTVTRTVLFSGPKQPVQNSAPVKRSAEEAEFENQAVRRDLTLNAWPAYNSTLAPMATRSTFALAEDPSGLVVVAGGNEEDVLCMFNARENSWKNATALLAEANSFSASSIAKSSSISSATATATPTSTPSTTTETAAASGTSAGAAAVGGTNNATTTNTILAVVLSSIFGIAIVLFGIYYCLQRKRRQNAHMEAGHMRRASGASSNEKSGIGYATNSLPQGPAGAGVFRGHQTQDSQSSFSSMAILMGRLNQQKPGQSAVPVRNTSQNTKRSSVDSTFKAFKSTISKPIPQASAAISANRPLTPAAPPMQMRDEKGVSFAPGTVEPRPRSPSTTAGLDREGDTRRSSGWNRYWSGGSALGLLGFGNGNGNANNAPNANSKRTTVASESSSRYSNTQHRITQDSATVPPLQIYEPRASFSRVASRSPTIAQHNEKLKEAMLGKIETQRPVSAISSVSGYSSGIPASVHEAWDPTNSQPWGYNQPQHGTFYNPGPYATPLAPASAKPSPQQQPPSHTRDDMSWLNLGDNR
jgi:hypothetical protein